MDKYQNTVGPPPPIYYQPRQKGPTGHPVLPNLLNFPAESQAERSSRGLALIFRDKELSAGEMPYPAFQALSPDSAP